MPHPEDQTRLSKENGPIIIIWSLPDEWHQKEFGLNHAKTLDQSICSVLAYFKSQKLFKTETCTFPRRMLFRLLIKTVFPSLKSIMWCIQKMSVSVVTFFKTFLIQVVVEERVLFWMLLVAHGIDKWQSVISFYKPVKLTQIILALAW